MTSWIEPKDLRTLRRPLNVVAMKAPVSALFGYVPDEKVALPQKRSIAFVAVADIQKSDYQPSGLRIFALDRRLILARDAQPCPSQEQEGQKRQTPHGHATIGQSGRYRAFDIKFVIYSANWRQG